MDNINRDTRDIQQDIRVGIAVQRAVHLYAERIAQEEKGAEFVVVGIQAKGNPIVAVVLIPVGKGGFYPVGCTIAALKSDIDGLFVINDP